MGKCKNNSLIFLVHCACSRDSFIHEHKDLPFETAGSLFKEAETGIVPSIDFQMKMCSKL